MVTPLRSFRLTEDDLGRLKRLKHEMGCSETDAVRYGLVALKALLDQGYQFRGPLPYTTVIERRQDGAITIFEVAPDGSLIEQGRAQWGDASDDE